MLIKTLSIIFTISFSFLNLKQATADDNNGTPFPCSLNEGEFFTYSGKGIGYDRKNKTGYTNPVSFDEKKNLDIPDIPADKERLIKFLAKSCHLTRNKTLRILKVFSPEPSWVDKILISLSVEQEPDQEQFFVAIEVIHHRNPCEVTKKITYVLEVISCEEENKIFVSTANKDDPEEEQQTGFLVRR